MHKLLKEFLKTQPNPIERQAISALEQIQKKRDDRMRWIENRKVQIEELDKLQIEICKAHDNKDVLDINQIYTRIKAIE